MIRLHLPIARPGLTWHSLSPFANLHEVRQIEHDARLGPLAARVNHFKYGEFFRVYGAFTPEKKRQLDPVRLRKRDDLLKQGKRTEVTQAESR